TANGATSLVLVDATGFAGTTHVLAGGEVYLVTAVNVGLNTLTIAGGLIDDLDGGAPVKRLRRAAASGSHKINVWGASALYPGAIVELDNDTVTVWSKERRTVQSVSGNVVTLGGAVLAQDYFEGQKVRVIEAAVTVRYAPDGVTDT